MVDSFEDLVKQDLDDIFLQEFSKEAIFKTSTSIKTVKVQMFQEPLDKLETLYRYCWCKFEDFKYVAKNDTLIVDDVEYGIVDFTHDEFNHTTTLFLDKV